MDGEVLINQGIVNTGGITPGDDPGFPAEVAYPPNLVIIGTVNLDETTLPISAKILDRAAYDRLVGSLGTESARGALRELVASFAVRD